MHWRNGLECYWSTLHRGGCGRLGQLAPVHHLPQQHTSTAEHVSKENAGLPDSVCRVAGAEDQAAAAASCWAWVAAVAVAAAAVMARVVRVTAAVARAEAVVLRHTQARLTEGDTAARLSPTFASGLPTAMCPQSVDTADV